jgi:mRNA interferase HigB
VIYVRVLALKTLRTFWEIYPQAERPLRNWYYLLENTTPCNLNDLKLTFNSVDYVRDKRDFIGWHIFDIGGNNWRVICKIDYAHQYALIKYVFTHAQYDVWNVKSH